MSALHLVADLCKDLLQCLVAFFLGNLLKRGMLIPQVVLVQSHGQDDEVTASGWNLGFLVMFNPSALVQLIGEACLWLPSTSDATSLIVRIDFQRLSMVMIVVIVLAMVVV